MPICYGMIATMTDVSKSSRFDVESRFIEDPSQMGRFIEHIPTAANVTLRCAQGLDHQTKIPSSCKI